MTIDEIRARYINFLVWDKDNLEEKVYKLSSEYGFFLNIFYETSKKMTIAQKEHDELWQGKYKVYKFEYDIQLSHNEIKTFLEKDNELIGKLVEVRKLQDLKSFLEECLKNLNNMRWDIKHYIQWKEFQKGI